MVSKLTYIRKNPDENHNDSDVFEQSPCVNFTVLDLGIGYRVKRVEVLPHKRLSYQKHQFHTEQWVIVQGNAKITLNNRTFSLKAGEVVSVGIGETPFVENIDHTEILIFIKIQCGSWFEEEGYFRFADDFDRPNSKI